MFTVITGVLGSGAFLAAFGWIVQLGNRIVVLETQQPDLKELINTQFADVGRRLTRIEVAMNGALHPGDK